MSSWEPDSDSEDWKKGELKPWEEADGWKLEDGYKPGETETARDPNVRKFLDEEFTIAVRPTVSFVKEKGLPDILVKDRDALKLVATLSSEQKATTEDGEVFQFSASRQMWIKIPKEVG